MKTTTVTSIGQAKGLAAEIQQRWFQVWVRAGGADREIPLAAFMRSPDLLVSGTDDVLGLLTTKRRTRYPTK